MRRLVVLLAATLLATTAAPALALPGPDPQSAPPRFEIFMGRLNDDPEIYESLEFHRSRGWDFGDRVGYSCAWIEFIRGGSVQFRVDFEVVVGRRYRPGTLGINDRGGLEAHPQTRCGDGRGPGAGLRPDGSRFVKGGVRFEMFSGQTRLTSYRFPAVSNDNAECFWSPGNQPREAYLWYDEDGSRPVPVLRAFFRPVANGVSIARA